MIKVKTCLTGLLLSLAILTNGNAFAERLSLESLQARIDMLEAELDTLRQQLADMTGSPGAGGADGLNCWDQNGNGVGDAAEDINGDGQWTAADCGGDLGPIYDLINELSTRLDLLLTRLESVDADHDGYTPAQGDCDDSNRNINPSASEILGDGIDNDCDGNVDQLADNDGDGFTVADGDCDNFDPNTYPGAPELRDGIDNDCDGTLDDEDRDGDGFSVLDGDCNDADPTVYPGAYEIPNYIDNDCDGSIQDEDHDGDGFTRADDCNDSNSSVRPGQTSFFSTSSTTGFDYNCDGTVERRWPEAGNCQDNTCSYSTPCGFSYCTHYYDCYRVTETGWVSGGSCGNTGRWVTDTGETNFISGTCDSVSTSRTQTCR